MKADTNTTRIYSFVVELATNSDLARRYSRDPAGVMSELGLNAREQAVLRSDNRNDIDELMAAELVSAGLL